ncbi:putative integral membrane protein; putative Succinyl-CoA ligase domain [Frankia alni ACN14a]|uniref:Integral membrane protein putative Succinyl-CoA ligase domain n=1 Tax=Frankia alni (strain DSM 45986 / CECT 9034 / ACN14a) TaxID=326424 RepID=Q0RE31_FRAAA|nr:hypothetical protein [Frankia sp. AvcI1]CAJ64282.1 putative integral membrane protein; putative Succinyl-CoA ligase domain [Frankia alni ACN14a]
MIWAATRVGRAVRTATVAGVAVGLATAAHLTTCARPPSLPVLGVGAALAARICWGVADRPMCRRRLAGLMLSVQVGLHVAFTLAMPTHGASRSGGLAGEVGPGGTVGHSGVNLLPGGPAMAAAHLGAALLLTWWLAIGEHALWRVTSGVVRVARRVVRRLRRRPNGTRRPRPGRAAWKPATNRPVRRLVLLRHVVIRRGPPVPGTT